jgi:hypothetical protein
MRSLLPRRIFILSFAVAIFAGAFLLFAVQPMIGKYILPWFGGSPEVWTACMLFFQALLLAGYLYAHLCSRYLGPMGQAVAHILLLAGAAAMLPIAPHAPPPSQAAVTPVAQILLLLTATVGLPYMVLSATSPLMQSWFARSCPGVNPYPLYALSNAGSLLALVSYPLVVEPLLSRRQQVDAWSSAWIGFAILCGACGLWAWLKSKSTAVPAAAKAGNDEPVSLGRKLLWLGLPAGSSVVLLAVTAKITQDLAVIPFLWVLPLCLYLLTFILCFSGPGGYARPVWTLLFVAAMAASIWLRSNSGEVSVLWQIGIYLATMFAVCMICHGELYRLRPGPGRLTTYYLAIAAGGAIGGFFTAVVAPMIFRTYLELYLGLLAICLFVLLSSPAPALRRRRWIWAGLVLVVFAFAIVFQGTESRGDERVLRRERNFYGVLTLWEMDADNPAMRRIVLEHGTTYHGVQFTDPSHRGEATAYYSPESGVGLAIKHLPTDRPRRVGIVGLGAGTLAAYGREGDVFRFYEINPAVEGMAKSNFTVLADSPAKTEVILGDARNSLQQEPPQQFDLLVLDAFSSDAIPVHLLTKEAFELYLKHLRPGGVLAVHVSTLHLDLQSVVFRMAKEFGLHTAWIQTEGNPARGTFDSDWMLLTSDAHFLSAGDIHRAALPEPPAARSAPLWTDDRTSLLEIIK